MQLNGWNDRWALCNNSHHTAAGSREQKHHILFYSTNENITKLDLSKCPEQQVLDWPQRCFRPVKMDYFNFWPMDWALFICLNFIWRQCLLLESSLLLLLHQGQTDHTGTLAHTTGTTGTAFLPGPLAPHHFCGRTREGPLSWVLSFKALPTLVTFLINPTGNQRCPKEQASSSKGCIEQSHGVAVSGLVIPTMIIIKTKDQVQGNSIPLKPPILTSI